MLGLGFTVGFCLLWGWYNIVLTGFGMFGLVGFWFRIGRLLGVAARVSWLVCVCCYL